MLGINELGNETADIFYEQYKTVIDEIRTLQPEAVIFVESIMHVSEAKDREGTYINNEEIYRRNDKIKLLADNKVELLLIDVMTSMCSGWMSTRCLTRREPGN